MSSVIYYFSGTGNSLVVARDISKKLMGELKSISSIIDKDSIETEADMIGLVFPMYHHSVPYIIKRFLNKIDNLNEKYIFGVCTYGVNPGVCLKDLANIIKSNNGKLAAGFAVKMPYNYISPTFTLKSFFKSFTLKEIPECNQREIFTNQGNKLEDIYEYIHARRRGKCETGSEAVENIIEFFNLKEFLRDTLQKKAWLKVAGFNGNTELSFQDSIKLMDYGFTTDNKCNGCRVCSKVCPVKNINMIDNKPVWQHKCEQCFACLHWCPQEAIQFGYGTKGRKRYHHPDVKLSEMMEGEKSIDNLSREEVK